jgi:uncharacterized protein
MSKVIDDLEQAWHSRLLQDFPRQSQRERDSIIQWLLGEDPSRFDTLKEEQLAIASQAMEFRYRVLQKRYLGVSPHQSYSNLIKRLGSLVMLRDKIRTWIAQSRESQKSVADVLQEVIQEMLNSDRYIQTQMIWISRCTKDERLRNSILFATIEEYCLRPIRNQPLLLFRFVNFLRRQSRSGMTQVPQHENLRLLSEEIIYEGSDSKISLLDNQAIAAYQENQEWEEQQTLRIKVQKEFEAYLGEKVGQEAVQWLKLYLQGRSQEAIAQTMNLPIKQVYRLREKVTYHAINVFALKSQTELVTNWLEISLKEHNFGLTPKLWEVYWAKLTPTQRQIVEELKGGKSLEAIAGQLGLKKTQIVGEWNKLYLSAQELRN